VVIHFIKPWPLLSHVPEFYFLKGEFRGPFLGDFYDFVSCELFPSFGELDPLFIPRCSADMCEVAPTSFYDGDGGSPELIGATCNHRRRKIMVECVIEFLFASIDHVPFVKVSSHRSRVWLGNPTKERLRGG
jgi:hypothetical protein